MLAVCDKGRAVGLRHYFYGGSLGVAGRLAGELGRRYPGLEVAGWGAPPFRELQSEEFERLQKDVAQCRPDVIWIGLGAPKQERFMAAHWRELDAGVLLGVGAAFDFHSGRVRQAPRWMQGAGLEWFHRFLQEPVRLAGRYLWGVPCFIALVLAEELGRLLFREEGRRGKPPGV
jgi:N-acetylglucosaminyldiphosphoundecaprenol N-acetyl-beta-D-mannosaminyltransferase